MYKKKVEAYQTIEKTTSSGRETEARVLNKAAQKLIFCQINWDSKELKTHLDDALKFNQRIWSIFQSELAKKDNPLPKEIKINLLRLSSFIDKRIFEIMAFPGKEKLAIIIKINKNISAGLLEGTSTKKTHQIYANKIAGIKKPEQTIIQQTCNSLFS